MVRTIPGLLVLSLLLVPASAVAQPPAELEAIRKEIEALRQAQDAVRKDVEFIRKVLEQLMAARPPDPAEAAAAPGGTAAGPGATTIRIAGRPARGAARAKVVLVEFSDYECPYCAQYATQIYPQIDREYIQTNKLRYVFKSFPIEHIHPLAFTAHVGAACAGDQGKYWEMHDRLFATGELHRDRLLEHALAVGLDVPAFRSCLESEKHHDQIREDIDEAVQGGVRGTPVFVLALHDPKSETVTPAHVLMGAQSLEAFRTAIDALLAKADSSNR